MNRKQHFRLLRWTALLLVFCLLTACQSQNQPEPESEVSEESRPEPAESEESPEPASPPSPLKGGTLTVSTVIQESYNPLTTEDAYLAQILSLMFSPLIDFDDERRPHPSIASEWEMAEDNRSVVLTIEPEAVWQDGSDVNAGDVAFSIEVIRQTEKSVYRECVAGIQETGVLDDDHIQITFTQSSPLNLDLLYFPIISREYYTGLGHPLEPMGCGPYKLDSYITMEKFILQADPDYFGPEPYIQTVEILLSRSDARMDSFNQGITNLAYTDDEIPWSTYMNQSRVSLHTFSGMEAEVLTFNLKRIKDADTRKAIAYALDAQEILRTTCVDKGDVTEIPVSPVRWYSPANPSHYGFSPEKAAELLDFSQELKWELLINRKESLQRWIAEMIQTQLKAQGIEIQIKMLEPSAYKEALKGRKFDMALETLRADNDRDLKAFLTDRSSNHAGYTSSAMEKLLTELAKQTEETGIHQGFVNIGNQLAEDLPYYFLFFRKKASLTGFGVKGSLAPTEHYVFRGVENLYIEVE